MVVFNLFAIPVVLVIGLICTGLYEVLPEAWATDEIEIILTGLVALVIGGVAELAGLKGRLFFIPIWLLGLLAMVIQGGFMLLNHLAPMYGYEDGWALAGGIGWWWLLAIPVAIAGLVVLLWLLQVWLWKTAPAELEKATELAQRPSLSQDEDEQLWHALGMAFFEPWGSHSQEVCAHNRKVTRLLLTVLSGKLTEEEIAAIEALDRALAPGENSAEKLDIDSEVIEPVKQILSQHEKGERWFPGMGDGDA